MTSSDNIEQKLASEIAGQEVEQLDVQPEPAAALVFIPTAEIFSAAPKNGPLPSVVIQEIVAFLPDKGLIDWALVSNRFKGILDNIPAVQERWRLRAVADASAFTKEQKDYLNTDLVKKGIRSGALTVAQALVDRTLYVNDYLANQLIILGFSATHLCKKDRPTPQQPFPLHHLHVELLRKYISQLDELDNKKSEEERKTEIESLSVVRAERLEAFFNMICVWPAVAAQAFLHGGFSLEQANRFPLSFADAHLEVLRNAGLENFEATFKKIQGSQASQMIAWLNPTGFSNQWILSENFSVEAYHFVLNAKTSNRQKYAATLEQLKPEQLALVVRGAPLEKVRALDLTITPERMKQMSEGLAAGFTFEDVQAEWFSEQHIFVSQGVLRFGSAPSIKIAPTQLRNLSQEQVYGLAGGLSREQVSSSEYIQFVKTCATVLKILSALKKGLTFEAFMANLGNLGDLEQWQREHVEGDGDLDNDNKKKLTVEQVTQPWFTTYHSLTIHTGRASYEQIAGFNVVQVRGILAGLTPTQVNQPWFKTEHLAAIEEGIPYAKIEGLLRKAVNKLRDEYVHVPEASPASLGNAVTCSSSVSGCPSSPYSSGAVVVQAQPVLLSGGLSGPQAAAVQTQAPEGASEELARVLAAEQGVSQAYLSFHAVPKGD